MDPFQHNFFYIEFIDTKQSKNEGEYSLYLSFCITFYFNLSEQWSYFHTLNHSINLYYFSILTNDIYP